MTEARRHTPITEGEGACWCGVQHHCCHIVPGSEGTEEVCCMCGDVLPILKLPIEEHGPWAYWLYVPQKVTPSNDVCAGFKPPPGDWPAAGTDAPLQVMR